MHAVVLLSMASLLVFTHARAERAEINLSESLVEVGIAERNLEPGEPAVDARRLFRAALDYARQRAIRRLTANPGAYYFLTTERPDRYVEIRDFEQLDVDLAGADLYFAQSHRVALWVTNCNGCTLRNFTVDYQQLPFTQVRERAVDVVGRRLQVEPMPGFDPPSAFNADRGLAALPDSLWGFAFRAGRRSCTPGAGLFNVRWRITPSRQETAS